MRVRALIFLGLFEYFARPAWLQDERPDGDEPETDDDHPEEPLDGDEYRGRFVEPVRV